MKKSANKILDKRTNKKGQTFFKKDKFEQRITFPRKVQSKSNFFVMNKKGQFYLLAAIIIVLILAGITSVKTYAITKPEPRAIQDLGDELKEETFRIVDYGIYNDKDMNELLNNFTDSEFTPYFLKKTDGTGIVFLYGNKTSLSAVQYNESVTGTISATIGTGVVQWQNVKEFVQRVNVVPDVGQDSVKVNLFNKSFDFKLKDNEMFYFVIVQEKDGETYVEKN